MAKSLGIRTPAGFANPESVEKAVLQPVTPTGNLGSIVMSILAASPDAMLLCVDMAARVVHACTAAGKNVAATLTAIGNTALLGSLEQSAPGRSAVFKTAGNANPAIEINADNSEMLEQIASKPALVSRSIASLVSAFEDAYSTPGALVAAGNNAILAIDQGAALVSVFEVEPADNAAVRAKFNAGQALADMARFEQIPAEEAVDASTTAFE
jgi:hypothetical protein